jgi:hypothetical protein
MAKLHVDYSVLLSFAIFSGGYFFVSYLLLSDLTSWVYQLVCSVIALIVYLNLLRYALLALYSLSSDRVSEYLGFLMMYLLTISVIGLPFFLEERSIVSVSFLHYIIIGFACIMLTKYTVFMLLGPWHDVKTANSKSQTTQRYTL